ncbi:MAG: NnrS family protein [Bacteriovoracaceae bacterium]|jgi:uncharacterized protein involved in response to NO|nr:NnrS family protein [Bacteriovoracaceae bacterium]
MKKTLPILSISFRPFFILAALIAVVNPVAWILNYQGHLSLPLTNVSPMFWHGHEMIFGFSGALIAGFILTASANWTSSSPYSGGPLLFLISLWLLERISYFLPLNESMLFFTMNLFFPTLTIMLLIKLLNFPKQKYVFIPILMILTIAKFSHSWGNLFSHDLIEVSGRHTATSIIRLIVLLIAGRVTPFFTRKKIEGVEITLPAWINPVSLIPIALLVVPWPESTPRTFLALVYLVAILGNITRQLMWKPHKTIKVPILFILHIGIALINLSLIQEFVGLFNENMYFAKANLHMLMTGGLGTVAMGIMSRVSLGHTGRVIEADKTVVLAYFCVIFGALLRVVTPLFFPDSYIESLYFSSSIWALGFLIFIIRFWGVLTGPRPDGK